MYKYNIFEIRIIELEHINTLIKGEKLRRRLWGLLEKLNDTIPSIVVNENMLNDV